MSPRLHPFIASTRPPNPGFAGEPSALRNVVCTLEWLGGKPIAMSRHAPFHRCPYNSFNHKMLMLCVNGEEIGVTWFSTSLDHLLLGCSNCHFMIEGGNITFELRSWLAGSSTTSRLTSTRYIAYFDAAFTIFVGVWLTRHNSRKWCALFAHLFVCSRSVIVILIRSKVVGGSKLGNFAFDLPITLWILLNPRTVLAVGSYRALSRLGSNYNSWRLSNHVS